MKGERGGGEEGLGHSTKAVVADCSDNGLSSSEGLRGRREVQAFRALPPNTSPVSWENVGRVRVLEQGGNRRGERGTFPPAAYGFRQGAGTEQSTIWVSCSRPVTNSKQQFGWARLASRLQAPPAFRDPPFSLLSLSCSQVLPTSQPSPGCLSILLSFFPSDDMPSSATEPKVWLLFLLGAAQTGLGLFLPLLLSVPPPETDTDDRLGVDVSRQ